MATLKRILHTEAEPDIKVVARLNTKVSVDNAIAEKNDDIQAQLQALYESYAEKLPEKLKEINQYWQIIMSEDDDSIDNMKTLHRLVHSLAGSGATFGFEELSQRARYIEQILNDWLQAKLTPARKKREGVSILLDQLSEFIVVPQSEELTSASKLQMSSSIDEASGALVYLLGNDAVIAEEVVMQLRNFSYQIERYNNSDELKAAFDNKPPVLVISDIDLPDENLTGEAVMRQLRESYGLDFPVIFISERESFKDRLLAVRSGGEAYFVKPVNIDQLVDRLDKLVHHDEPEPYRILIVDNDSTLAKHYELLLRQAGMKVSTLSRSEKIFEVMASCNPELILMDVHMTDCTGMELAKLIRQQDAYISVPIVYLSTESDHEKELAALHLGGDDFLTKPIKDNYLVSSVSIRVQRARQLSDLMSQDSLTGLLKHTRIKSQLATELSRSKRQRSQLIFAMIDIDHFKCINDNYGHMAGDRVIKSLSRLLQQRLRKSDSIGRYGGEEFAVVMPDTDIDYAISVVNEIRENFSEIEFLCEGEEFSVTLSAGLSGYPMYDHAEKINKVADDALYQAKENGRNCVVVR